MACLPTYKGRRYQSLDEIAQVIAAENRNIQPAAEITQPGSATGQPKTLKAKVGKKEMELNFIPGGQDNTLFTSNNSFSQESDANRVIKSLSDRYSKLDFQAVNTTADDPFAENNFVITARPKQSGNIPAKQETELPESQPITETLIPQTNEQVQQAGQEVAQVPEEIQQEVKQAQQEELLDEPPLRKWSINRANKPEDIVPVIDISNIDTEKSAIQEGIDEGMVAERTELVEYRGKNQWGDKVGTVRIKWRLPDGDQVLETYEVFFTPDFSAKDLKPPILAKQTPKNQASEEQPVTSDKAEVVSQTEIPETTTAQAQPEPELPSQQEFKVGDKVVRNGIVREIRGFEDDGNTMMFVEIRNEITKGVHKSSDESWQEYADRIGMTRQSQADLKVKPETPAEKSGDDLKEQIKQAESKVDTNPTEAQKKAGNYKKGHLTLNGFDITIENPKGSTRSGVDPSGKKWSVEMKHTYGYFLNSEGRDGDHIDVFIGDNPESTTIFVVDQIDPDTGAFDESKVMMGFNSAEEAKQGYLANYSAGWKGLGQITEVPVDDFKTWLYDGAKQRIPFGDYKGTPQPIQQTPSDEFVGDVVKPKAKGTPATKPEKEAGVPKEIPPEPKEEEIPEEPQTPDMQGWVDWVVRYSTDPAQLYLAWQHEIEYNIPANNLEDWQRTVLSTYVNPTSWNRHADRNVVTQRFAKRWLRKNGANLDQIATDKLGWEGGTDDIQRIIDFMVDVANNPSAYLRKTTDNQRDAERRFRQIMGYSIKNFKTVDKNVNNDAPIDESTLRIIDNFKDQENIEITSIEVLESLRDEWFDGFPYEQSDYDKIYNYLKAQGREKETDETAAITDTEGDTELPGESGGSAAEGPTATQREVARIRDEYQVRINELKATLVTPEEIKRRQEAELRKANKKINLFGQEGEQGEEDMFAADIAFGTTSDEIRKRVEDEAKAENKKINEQLERLRNDMNAEIKLAEGQIEIRFSLQPEDKAITIETPEFKQWFGDSKVVNENGKPLVVYHGTGKDFDVFDIEKFATATDGGWFGKGFYFTSDPSVASTYSDNGIQGGDSVMPVYLSLQNPFDFTGKNPRELMDKYGGAEGFTKWAKSQGYDGAIGFQQYVVFDATQIKSATGNSGAFDATNPDIRFQLREDEPISDNLVALHNINESDIRNVNKLGGMVAPSIAIVQKETPFTDFGGITLIADKQTVYPNRSSVKVFKGDVYSPTVPRPQWYVDTKRHKAWVNRVMSKTYAKYREIASRVQNIIDDFGSFGKSIGNTDRVALKESVYDDMKVVYLIENDIPVKIPMKGYPIKVGLNWYVTNISPEQKERARILVPKFRKETEASSQDLTPETYEALKELAGDIVYAETIKLYGNNTDLPEGFAEDEAKSRSSRAKDTISVNLFTDSLQDHLSGRQQIDGSKINEAIEKTFKAKVNKKAYDEWLTDKVNEFQGAKYFEKGNQKVPYTLENLIDATIGQTRGKEKGMTFGMNRAKSFAVKQLKSVPAMHKAKKDLVTKERMTEIEQELQAEYFQVADKIKYKYDDQWGKLDDFGRSLADYYKGASPQSALARNGFSPDRWDAEKFKEFADKLADSPIDYFEAKMQRGVDLSEFKYAVVPKDTSKDVIDILKSKGIKVKKYTTDEDRAKLVDEIATRDSGVRFQLQPSDDVFYSNSIKALESIKQDKEQLSTYKQGSFTVPSFDLTDQLREVAQQGLPLFKITENPSLTASEYVGDNLDTEKFAQFHSTLTSIGEMTGQSMGITVKTVKSPADLPANIRSEVVKQNRRGHLSPALYVMSKGKPPMVYLISSQTRNTDDAARNLLHEVVAHHGLRQLFGAEYDNLLRQVWKQMTEADKRSFAGLYRTADRLLIADEWLARQAETFGADSPGIVKRAIAQIRQWLRRMFPGMKFTDDDLKVLFAKSREALQKQQEQTTADDVRFQIIGEQGAQRLTEAGLAVDSIRNLQIAKDMESSGKTEKEIWLATGWQRGVEKKWRLEIPDSTWIGDDILKKAYQAGVWDTTVGELVEQEELFTAYPELKDMMVIVVPYQKFSLYDPEAKRISLGWNVIDKPVSDLIHEVQHVIQQNEGFAQGGSVNLIRGKIKQLDSSIDYYNEQMDLALQRGEKDVYENMMYAKLDIVKQIQKYQDEYGTAYGGYKKLAGEVEARNAQTRMTFDDLKRAETMLSESEDVAREDQIVLMESVKSALANPDIRFSLTRGVNDKSYLDEIAQNIESNNYPPYLKYALRVIDSGYEMPKIGDILPPSRLWDDGDVVEGQFLNGTSGVSIQDITEDVRLSIHNVDDYYGDKVLLIGSNDYEYGTDQGEIVLRNARVYDIFDKPQIRFTLQPPPPNIAQPSNEQPITAVPMLDKPGDLIREMVQDKMLSVRRLQEEILRRGGVIPEKGTPYETENRSTSVSKVQMDNYEEKVFNPFVRAINAIIEQTKWEYKDVVDYLKAKHAPERNRVVGEGKRVAAGSIDGNLLTDDTAKWYIDQFENEVRRTNPDLLKPLWNTRNEATRFTLKRWLNDGFISRAEYDQYTQDYKDYVPLRGWEGEKADEIFSYTESETGNAFNPNKHAKGRTSEADDPVPYIISMAHSAIVAGNKNQVKREMLNLVRANVQMTDLFTFNKTYMVVDEAGNVISESQTRPDPATLQPGQKITTRSDNPHKTRRPKYQAKEHEVELWESGQRIVMAFPGDPKIAQAINGTNIWAEPITRAVQNTVGAVSRYLSIVLTSKNPAFIPINWMRDVAYAATSQAIQKDGDVKAFMANVPIAAKAIHRHLSGKADLNPNQVDRLYAEAREMGIETGYVHLTDLNDIERKVERELRTLAGKRTNRDIINDTAYKAIGRYVEYLAIQSENMSRFSVYLTAYENNLKKGMTQAAAKRDAAVKAKDATVNFNRKGRMSGLIGSLYLFFNATVQGGHNIFKLAKDNPKAFAKASIGFMVLGALTSEITRLFAPPDDDGENSYDNLSAFIKRNYLVLPNPAWLWGKGKDKFITLPLPQGFRSLFSWGVIAAEFANGQTKPLQGVFEGFANQLDAFSPLNFNANQIVEKGITGGGVARMITPSFAMPLVDVALNQDFSGNPVYREAFTKALEARTPDSELGMPYVSETLYQAARVSNKLFGGDELRPATKHIDKDGRVTDQPWRGMFDWNPSIVEHLIEGYTGGVGTEFNNTIKLVENAAKKLSGDPKAEIYTRNVPVLRRLYRTAGKDDSWREYMDIKNKVEDYKYYLNKYKSAPDIEMFKRMVGNRELNALDKMIKKTDKTVDKLRDAIDASADKKAIDEYYQKIDDILKNFLDNAKKLSQEETK